MCWAGRISLERFDHLPDGHSLHCELPFNKSVVPERSSKLKRLVTFAIAQACCRAAWLTFSGSSEYRFMADITV